MRYDREFPGAKPYTDRHGKRRWRFRRKGFTAELGTEYASLDFVRRYEAALQAQKTKGMIGADRTRPGSLAALVASWKASPTYRGWEKSTKITYGSVAERLREAHGDKRVSHLQTHHVAKLMAEKADRPTAANRIRKVMAMLLDHAIDMGWRTDNPRALPGPTKSKVAAITPGPRMKFSGSMRSTRQVRSRIPQ